MTNKENNGGEQVSLMEMVTMIENRKSSQKGNRKRRKEGKKERKEQKR